MTWTLPLMLCCQLSILPPCIYAADWTRPNTARAGTDPHMLGATRLTETKSILKGLQARQDAMLITQQQGALCYY